MKGFDVLKASVFRSSQESLYLFQKHFAQARQHLSEPFSKHFFGFLFRDAVFNGVVKDACTTTSSSAPARRE